MGKRKSEVDHKALRLLAGARLGLVTQITGRVAGWVVRVYRQRI